jgi:hypothetical protein
MSSPSLPSEYEDDPGVALVYDTLCQRGYEPDVVRRALDVYEGNLWLEIFGLAVSHAAELIGLKPFPFMEE